MSVNPALKLARFSLGLYLAYHFLSLIPHAGEMFGAFSWLNANAGFPSFMRTDGLTIFYLLTLAASGFLIGINRWLVGASLYAWVGMVSLLARNPFYYELTLDYLGWLCLAQVVLRWIDERDFEYFQIGGWILLGVTYLASGISKLDSIAWRTGDAISYFYSSDIISRFPPVELGHTLSSVLSWGTVGIEVLFLPAILMPRARPWAWTISMLMHIALALTTQLTEISLAMIVFHLFLFDMRWFEDAKWLKKKMNVASF